MSKPKTHIEADFSYTIYRPDEPFELIDTDARDYGEEINKVVSELYVAADGLLKPLIKLYEIINEAKKHGDVEIRIGSISNAPWGYGCLDTTSLALLLLGLSSGLKDFISFRSYKEGYEIVWKLLVQLVDLLDLGKSKTWHNLLNRYKSCGGVSFFNDTAARRFRITALALKLMGQKNWSEFQECEESPLDDFGHAIVFEEGEIPAVLIEKNGSDAE